ncbi:SMI1/KNR4 family protein, partial [Streptomyces sp. NPDC059835]|uniref:SMI1/KNR4 family protein n=1 Tax=Streptomyces sp. NPDC059835 TaxID=3346967 RepID=UPI003666B88E
MSGKSFNWHEFLGRWQEEWVARRDPDNGTDEEGSPGPFRLGRPAADEAAIRAAETRLGRRLPASYRAFLAVSDGWFVEQMAGVRELGGTTDIDWFRDPFDMAAQYEENLGDDPREEEVLLAGMWRRALRLETDSDMSYALLDPGDRDEDGEWALYLYKGWGGELPDRYPSFRAYMEAMYRGFHSTQAGDPGFVNATTRAQDARVEEARLLSLRGRHEEAVPLLEEALSFGRPRSGVLLEQVRQLLGRHGSGDYGDLAADPRHLPEVLPMQAMAPAQGHRDDYWLGMMAARGVDREAARTVLDTLRDGTHRYAPPGAWGRAVA